MNLKSVLIVELKLYNPINVILFLFVNAYRRGVLFVVLVCQMINLVIITIIGLGQVLLPLVLNAELHLKVILMIMLSKIAIVNIVEKEILNHYVFILNVIILRLIIKKSIVKNTIFNIKDNIIPLVLIQRRISKVRFVQQNQEDQHGIVLFFHHNSSHTFLETYQVAS